MKKIKYLNVFVNFANLFLSSMLLWNIGIAADERMLVIDLLNKFNYIFWLLLFSGTISLIINLIQLYTEYK